MKTYEDTFMLQVQNLKGKRNRKGRDRLIESANISDECNIVESLTSNIYEPNSLKEALNGTHAEQWKEAVQSEYNSLISNKTWELVPRPQNTNIVGNKWVFKVKRKCDGSIDRFKARFCARGFTQSHGVDYEEVFSPRRSYGIHQIIVCAR